MATQYSSPVDKLARRILKAAARERRGQLFSLSVIKGWFASETGVAIGAAVVHAVSSGWMAARGDAWVITEPGEELGKRTRAGIGNKRRRL
jgi:hypothetical protein